MIRRYIDLALHPERYHGHGQRGPFFEGWYYKLVSADERHRYAIIPGIFLGIDRHKDHSFVQVLDGMTGTATYHSYSAGDFQAAADSFAVHVGPNTFSADTITLDIDDPALKLTGELRFSGLIPWPTSWVSPGIMGWYGWLPFMECYHGVVSLDHSISGVLTVNNQQIDFSGGRGYIEKDWGQAFPSAYIWMQTNHFETPSTSFTGSIAVIPWRRQSFVGFILGLWHDNRLYRFATYTGSVVEHLRIEDDHVVWVLHDRKYRIELWAERRSGGLLKAPVRTEMHKRVDETMQSRVEVCLTELKSGTTIFEGAGCNAALEVHGELERLLQS